MADRVNNTKRSGRKVAMIAVALGVIALLAAGAWRWWPRGGVPASAAIQAATTQLVSASDSKAPHPEPPAHPKTAREHLIAAAFAMRGIPYRWGAKGPSQLDCSGFTKAAYAKVGVALPDGSFNQAKNEKPLSSGSQMAPGDLIFYRWARGKGVRHITMYAGDGWVIGTGSPGQPLKVTLYPLSADLVNDGRVLTYRHIALSDEH